MSTPIERRLNKLEAIRDRNDVESEVDKQFEKLGTSRAAVLADFGPLAKFRDWLITRAAETGHQAGVPIAMNYRKWQGDCAISAKWSTFFDQTEALQAADTAARSSHPTR
jgi:hypothetical protein